MILFYSCADYLTPILRVTGDVDAPAICRMLEVQREDGFAVVAWRGGKYYADVDGYYEQPGPDPFDLACERRFD